MRELDTESEVRLKGALVSPPEFDYTDQGQPRCRLVFPKKCTGKGELNLKPYWLQVVVFGELAVQAAELKVGSIVVTMSHINANRWYGRDGAVKTSQNYIAFKVGVVKSLTDSPEWLPGAPRKPRVPKVAVAESVEPDEDEVPWADDGREDLSRESVSEVDMFLHGQAARSAAQGDGVVPEVKPCAEVQGGGRDIGSAPAGGIPEP